MSRASLLAVTSLSLVALVGCVQSGANRSAVIRCTPGERVDVSCGCYGLGEACTGDPGIRLCDATLDHGACDDALASTIAGRESQCDRYDNDEPPCPLATTFCPASGMIAVSTFATPDYANHTAGYTCRWEARRAPLYAGPTTTFGCIAGEVVRASCGCRGMGRPCEGNPSMRACEPGAACNDTASSLDYDDSTCLDGCPLVQATCPTSGAIVIATESYSSRFRCDVSAIGDQSGVLHASGL